jgi:hypothetical protein
MAARGAPRLSALALSGIDRLLGAGAVVAILWVGVYWAMN